MRLMKQPQKQTGDAISDKYSIRVYSKGTMYSIVRKKDIARITTNQWNRWGLTMPGSHSHTLVLSQQDLRERPCKSHSMRLSFWYERASRAGSMSHRTCMLTIEMSRLRLLHESWLQARCRHWIPSSQTRADHIPHKHCSCSLARTVWTSEGRQ